MVLTEAGWGRDDPGLPTRVLADLHANGNGRRADLVRRLPATHGVAANAVRFLDAFSRIDVRHRLAELRVPTLVLHSRGDLRIPYGTGRRIAATIPGAEFVGLESSNHLLLGREPASHKLLAAVSEFLSR